MIIKQNTHSTHITNIKTFPFVYNLHTYLHFPYNPFTSNSMMKMTMIFFHTTSYATFVICQCIVFSRQLFITFIFYTIHTRRVVVFCFVFCGVDILFSSFFCMSYCIVLFLFFLFCFFHTTFISNVIFIIIIILFCMNV